ncbi:SIR2 family protein [Streptosporangium sp. G11]|uniref:SIR2 family protein n=1 Tax=Streptosporangium sp. G11 TaxID=3436926 RepID=UPI003EB8C96A
MFELVGFDLSKSLLSFFNELNEQVAPNELHRAVAKYYRSGLAVAPVFFTVNWDTLQERAFRELGFEVLVGGPGQRPKKSFDSPASEQVAIFHPHGSFQTRDVVCSYRREVVQLPVASSRWLNYPMVFLGYSGYEPSLYDHLHGDQAQLWCVRKLEDDMQIPAKRRLLCRPNVFVYEGDLQEILKTLGLLDAKVALESNYLQLKSRVPHKVVELLSTVLASSLDPNACLASLSATLGSSLPEPEATIRYCMIMRCLISHIRDRIVHPEVLPALIAASNQRDSEQLWISAIAYHLRTEEPSPNTVSGFLDRAQEAAKKWPRSANPLDKAIFSPGTAIGRSKVYREFVSDSAQSLHAGEYILPPLYGGGLAGVGEFAELLAFEYLRRGDTGRARNIFDYAATRFYLSGNWNAGRLNEWASVNIERVKDVWDCHSLLIPYVDP